MATDPLSSAGNKNPIYSTFATQTDSEQTQHDLVQTRNSPKTTPSKDVNDVQCTKSVASNFGQTRYEMSSLDEKLDITEKTALLSLSKPFVESYIPSAVILLSTITTATVGCIVRHLTTRRGISAASIAFLRGVTQVALTAGLIVLQGPRKIIKEPSMAQLLLLCGRGMVAALGINLRFATLARLPVGIAKSLIATAPIFSGLLGWGFLGQRLTPIDTFSLCATTVGAIMIALSNPDADETNMTQSNVHIQGVILGLLTAVFSGSEFVLLKKMGTHVHWIFAMAGSGVFFVLVSFVSLVAENKGVQNSLAQVGSVVGKSELDVQLCLLGIVVLGMGSGICICYAGRMLAPGRTGVLRTTEIPVNFLLGFVILHEFPSSVGVLLGSLMIIMSTVLTSVKGT